MRQDGGGTMQVQLPQATRAALSIDSDVLRTLGLAPDPGPALLGKVDPAGAGARAGLRSGDVVTSVDGKPTRDGIAVIEAIRASQGRTITLGVQRDGAVLAVAVTPELDPKDKVPRIRAELRANPEMVTVTVGPIDAVAKATDATWNQLTLMVKSIAKMFTGQVSIKNLSGPVTIADYAEQSANQGLIVFLSFIAAISIGMGVMNLLPIPVLDGGLLLYYSLEVLTGRPLPERIGQYVQYLGFVLFIMLMSLALFNDVARLLT